MEKAIMVDGREVRLRSSAGLPRLYRMKFRRDIIQDMNKIHAAITKSEESSAGQEDGPSDIPMEALEMFENVAYLMAKHADPSVPSSVEEWLDGFEAFSIYEIFPVIQELWTANMETMSTPAKK